MSYLEVAAKACQHGGTREGLRGLKGKGREREGRRTDAAGVHLDRLVQRLEDRVRSCDARGLVAFFDDGGGGAREGEAGDGEEGEELHYEEKFVCNVVRESD